MDWKQALMAAGATAGVVAVLHYLLKEEAEAEKKDLVEKLGGAADCDGSSEKERVRKVLAEMLASQDEMKSAMREITKELLGAPHTFEEVYKKVETMLPSDPLEKCGLSMEAFDQMVTRHQSDPVVREAIGRMMGAPSPSMQPPSAKAMETTVKTLVEVHEFMAKGLTGLVAEIEGTPNKASLDPKTAMMAAQTVVGVKVEAKFGLSSEDLEACVMANQEQLQTSQDFEKVSLDMQNIMTKLMEAIGAN